MFGTSRISQFFFQVFDQSCIVWEFFSIQAWHILEYFFTFFIFLFSSSVSCFNRIISLSSSVSLCSLAFSFSCILFVRFLCSSTLTQSLWCTFLLTDEFNHELNVGRNGQSTDISNHFSIGVPSKWRKFHETFFKNTMKFG